jgi:hypothetical protein
VTTTAYILFDDPVNEDVISQVEGVIADLQSLVSKWKQRAAAPIDIDTGGTFDELAALLKIRQQKLKTIIEKEPDKTAKLPDYFERPEASLRHVLARLDFERQQAATARP